MTNRIIDRMRKMAGGPVSLDDIKSVVANSFLDCISENVEYKDVLDYIKCHNLNLKKFEQSKNYQEMVLTNCFMEAGGVGIILEDLSQQYPELELEWDSETAEKIQEIVEECNEYATKELSIVMSAVIYDVIDAA